MAINNPGGYAWAMVAGLNAALAAVSAKLFTFPFLKYGLVIFFNVTMWGCYVNSLKALSSLQATVTNFATNFLSSGLAGYFIFEEPLPSRADHIFHMDDVYFLTDWETLDYQWFAGAILIILGVFILSQSSIKTKPSSD